MAGAVSGLHMFANDVGPDSLALFDTNNTLLSNAINKLASFTNYYVDTGSANSVMVAVNSPQICTAYTDGLELLVKIAATTTSTTPTLTINSLTPRVIVNADLSALQTGQLQAASFARVIYDASNSVFRLGAGSLSLPYYPQTSAESTASVTPVNYTLPAGNVLRYGTNTTPGTTDMAGAINAALSCNTVVLLPAGLYRVASTVSIPAGVMLQGCGVISPIASGSGVGSAIVGDLSLSPVVQLGAGTLVGGALKWLGVFRAAGTPASGSIGVVVSGGQGQVIEDVFSESHQIPFYVSGTTAGIATMVTRLFTGGAYDAHVVLDTYPEVRFSQCRFGANSTGDQNCMAYVRVQGGNASAPAAGPNTFTFENCQFNQGGGTHAAHLLEFVSLTSPGVPTIDAGELAFTGCHAEAIGTAFISGDSSWNTIQRVGFANCGLSSPSIPFFALNSATVLNEWRFTGNWISASTFNPGVAEINDMTLTGNTYVNTAITFNATGSYTLTHMGNALAAGATLSLTGNAWNSAIFADVYRPGSTFSNSGTPNTAITVLNPGQSLVSWTPTLQFGGGNTGLTYSTQSGALQVVGNRVTYQWRIVLSAKGSSTGNATVQGFPITHSSSLYQTGAGGVCFGSNHMAGLTGPIIAQGPISTAPGQIQLLSQGAAGTVPLTDANFTNTSDFSGSVTFFF